MFFSVLIRVIVDLYADVAGRKFTFFSLFLRGFTHKSSLLDGTKITVVQMFCLQTAPEDGIILIDLVRFFGAVVNRYWRSEYVSRFLLAQGPAFTWILIISF